MNSELLSVHESASRPEIDKLEHQCALHSNELRSLRASSALDAASLRAEIQALEVRL